LIFYDDDMMPSSDSVQRHVAFHTENQGIVCGFPVENRSAEKTDVENYKAWLSKKWTKKYEPGCNVLRPDSLFFTAANCSFKKAVFWQLGGFDEAMTDCEDFALAHTALKQGVSVFFDKDNQALHREELSCHAYIIRLRAYASARQKWQRANRLAPADHTSYRPGKRIIYKAFASSVWVRMIDRNFFLFMPLPMRYRLYSIIIQSLANEYPTVPL
jgi:hypothetical protein